MKTINYYNKNAKNFIDNTLNVDFTMTQNRFLSYLKSGSSILDFGCGSGRDTKYFMEQGYKVEAIDGSEELCLLASKYTGLAVKHMFFQDLNEDSRYDGIWACSSILHLHMNELIITMNKILKALVSGGVLYTSFKYGTFEGERNGRYFTDMNEERLVTIIQKVDGFELMEKWITCDVRPGRGEEQWLNVILRKK